MSDIPTPASDGGEEHTLETAAEQSGGGYGGPESVDPGTEGSADGADPDAGDADDEAGESSGDGSDDAASSD